MKTRFILESKIDESILMTKERRTSISVLLNSIVEIDPNNMASTKSNSNSSTGSLPGTQSNSNSFTNMPGVGSTSSNITRSNPGQVRTSYSSNSSSNKSRVNSSKTSDQKTPFSIVRIPLVPINEEES